MLLNGGRGLGQPQRTKARISLSVGLRLAFDRTLFLSDIIACFAAKLGAKIRPSA
jgi:hypothetical protein